MPADSDRALDLLRRHGDHATSFQILERGFEHWFGDDAVVGYVTVGSRRVVASRPICARGHELEVTTAFLADCARHRKRALFFSADEAYVSALSAVADCAAVKIGEQPVWEPSAYSLDGPRRKTLRAQVNRARNKGVAVERLEATEVQRRRAEIQDVLDAWRASRRMGVMRFLVDLQPFAHAPERRYYLATRDGRPVGFLAAVPVYRRKGWFIEDMVRTPRAPNGTVEMLVARALADAHDEADGYATLGLAPLARTLRGPGPHRLLRWCFAMSWDHLSALYDFAGIQRFKARFRPDGWEPQYLAAASPRLGLLDLHAVLRAFAGRGLLGFGLETLRRAALRVGWRVWLSIAVLGALAGAGLMWALRG